MAELSIEQIIAKKEECFKRSQMKYVDIHSKYLDGEIKFHSLATGDLADARDQMKSDSEKGYLYFIYLSSDTLRDKDILKAYGCDKKDQHLIVKRLFPKESERAGIMKIVLELNGLTSTDPDEIYAVEVEELKN